LPDCQNLCNGQYACGRDVRPSATRPGQYTKWHGGGLADSSTLLVCRENRINWAVLFNSDATKDGKAYGPFLDLLNAVYEILGVRASAESQARTVEREWKSGQPERPWR